MSLLYTKRHKCCNPTMASVIFNRYLKVLVIGGVFLFMVILLTMNYTSYDMIFDNKLWNGRFSETTKNKSPGEDHILKRVRGYLVDTPGCKIPFLDAWDPMIRRIITDDAVLKCWSKQRFPHLVDSNHTHIFLTKSGLEAYNVSLKTPLQGEVICCYREMTRQPSNMDNVDMLPPNLDKSCTQFLEKNVLEEEFLQVECYVNKTLIHIDTHAFVPLKKEVEERANKLEAEARSRGVSPNVSVLIVGIDSLSKYQFYRHMQETQETLLDFDAIELEAHNILINTTQPNLTPILTGIDLDTFMSVCADNVTVSENCPFIWNKFRDKGYRTAYGEDSSWMNTYTIGMLYGFRSPPTDYFLRPYMIQSEKSIGNWLALNRTFQCIGSRSAWADFLKYINKFARSMSSHRYFSFFWCSSLCHDNGNNTKLGDINYRDFFRELHEARLSEEAVIVFMSDHGKRFRELDEIYQGRVELRNPFVYFLFPEWMKKKFPKAISNFRTNAKHLTSHYDLHKTLLALSDLTQLSDDYVTRTTINKSSPGSSLFLQIPDTRTCADINIPDKWCTCQMSESLSVNDESVISGVGVVIDHMNGVIKSHKICDTLKLDEVLEARVEFPPPDIYNDSLHSDGMKEYFLVFRVKPGDMTVRTTLRYLPGHMTYSYLLSNDIHIVKSDDINVSCVDDSMRRYGCYCIRKVLR